jgi:heat shock protein HslJ
MLRFLPIAFLLTTCGPDETVSGFVESGATYTLTDIDGSAFTATATISFGENGNVNGHGPCNTFRTTQLVPYPWFELGPIASTRMACPDLTAEGTYFTALSEMTLAEVSGAILILSNDTGREMVFHVE